MLFRRDDGTCRSVRLPEPVADADLVLLHAPDGFRAELPTALAVVRERRVHDHRVNISQRKVDLLALVHLFGVEVVERPPRGRHLEQVEVLRVGVQYLQRTRLERAVRLRSVRHRQQVHPRVVHGRRTERQVAGGELDRVLVDVEAAKNILHEPPVQLVRILRLNVPGLGDSCRDRPDGRHQERAGAARWVDDPQFRHGARIGPVDETAPSASRASMMADRLFV